MIRKLLYRFLLDNKIYPDNQEKTACVDYSSVYNPPEELQIPESLSRVPHANESNQAMTGSNRSSNADFTSSIMSPREEQFKGLSDVPGAICDMDSKSSSSATITPVAKSFPK